jgi:hypothetical protein
MGRLREFWFGEADIRPVALFRILFGALLFNWFWQLFPNLSAFFTDEGILPRRAQGLSDGDRFSLLNVSGDWSFVAVIWLVSCLVALALTLGFVPLWLAFTPAGERWSIDARRRDAPVVRGWALPIRVLELQIAWIYLATGLEKLAGIDWINGTAAYYALQLEHTFARPWAHAIAVNPILSHLVSWYTLGVELSFLPLAMFPSQRTRLVAALGAAAMQLGILVLMNVGNFPLVMLAAGVLFIPPDWIHRIIRDNVTPAPSMPRARSRLAGAALIAVAAIAFSTAVPSMLEPIRPSGDAASALRSLSLDQRWDMFSPNAARSDGWLLAPATLADGTRLDLLSSKGADDRSERYSDPLYSRWTKVHERIASDFYALYRSEYARHLCRTHNSHLGPAQSPLVSVELIWVERLVQAPEKGSPLITENELSSQQC